jgi:ferredoxin
MNVAVDREACAGHGLCYVYAPNVFTDDDQGYAQVVSDGVVAAADE